MVERPRSLTLHVVDVGQGDCALVECPNGHWIMIDCGSSGDGELDAAATSVRQILGAARLDALVITHPDADHFNWIEDVLGDREIGRVIVGGAIGEYPSELTAWLADRADGVDTLPKSYHDTEPNAQLDCGEARVHVLAANVPSRTSTSNAASIVLRFEYRGRSLILSGDATRATERAILGWYAAEFLDADVLKLGHHGSRTTSLSPRWISAVDPDMAFASAGENRRYRHMQHEALEAVRQAPELRVDAACHDLHSGARTKRNECTRWGRPWCDFNTTAAVFSTRSNGNLTFRFGDELEVEFERGQCRGGGPEVAGAIR